MQMFKKGKERQLEMEWKEKWKEAERLKKSTQQAKRS